MCTPRLRDSTETEPDLCLSVSCGGTGGQQWPAAGAGALGTGALVRQPVALALLEEVAINPSHRAPEQTNHEPQNNHTKEILTLLRKF